MEKKEDAHSDKPTDKYHFSSAQRFSIFQLVVFILQPTTSLFGSLSLLISGVSSLNRQMFSAKGDEPTVRYREAPNGNVSDYLVNTVEHLAAKEPDISFRSWWRPKKGAKTRLEMNTKVTLKLTLSPEQLYKVIICRCCVYSLLRCPQVAGKKSN